VIVAQRIDARFSTWNPDEPIVSFCLYSCYRQANSKKDACDRGAKFELYTFEHHNAIALTRIGNIAGY
jgi:hypothetical protein